MRELWSLACLLLLICCQPAHGVGSTLTSDETEPQRCLEPKQVKQPFKLPKLKIQWDAWETSQMTTSTASIILRERLGFDVEFVTGVSPRKMYEKLAAGEIHLAFEAWPASNPAEFNKYTNPDEGKTGEAPVRKYPYNNLFGRSGLFESCDRIGGRGYSSCRDSKMLVSEVLLKDALPDPSVREHFSVENVQNPSQGKWYPSQCATAGVNCSVQVMHIAPTGYDEGQVESLLEQMGLPAHVAYLGADAHTQKVWNSYTKKAGTLLYSYSPNANQEGVSILSLPRAQIDPKLDFKPQLLQKLAWPGLKDVRGGDASAFIESFILNEDDYKHLASLYDKFRDPHKAACAWVKEHPSTWEKWVLFPERQTEPFFCLRQNDGICDYWYQVGWALFFIQIILLLGLFSWSHWLKQEQKFDKNIRSELDMAIAKAQAADTHSCVVRKESFVHTFSKKMKGNYDTRQEFVNICNDVPRSLTHVRTYESFIAKNGTEGFKDPPDGGADRWIAQLNRASLLPYLFLSSSDGMLPVIIDCIGLSFISGCIATYFYLVVNHQTFQMDFQAFSNGTPWTAEAGFYANIKHSRDAFTSLIDAFKFFPSFLQIGFLGYAVSRWRSNQETSYNICGALHSTALVIGSSLTNPESDECKMLAFRVQRYFTAVHILAYKGFNRWFQKLEWRDFIALGLLTPEETQLLNPLTGACQRETMVGWIARDMYEGVKNGLICHKVKCTLATDVRGWIATINAMPMIGQPNLWSALMKFVVDLLILMFVFGNPFTAFMYEQGPFQAYVVVFTFLQCIPWLCASKLVTTLSTPYKSSHDQFHTDALVAFSEQVTYHNLRCSFNFPYSDEDRYTERTVPVRALTVAPAGLPPPTLITDVASAAPGPVTGLGEAPPRYVGLESMPMSPDAQRLASSNMKFLGSDRPNAFADGAIQESVMPLAPVPPVPADAFPTRGAPTGSADLVPSTIYTLPRPAEPHNTNSNRVMTSPIRSGTASAHFRSAAANNASAPTFNPMNNGPAPTFTPLLQAPGQASIYQGANAGYA